MGPVGHDAVRFVLHCDVGAEDVERAVEKFQAVIRDIPREMPSESGRETRES